MTLDRRTGTRRRRWRGPLDLQALDSEVALARDNVVRARRDRDRARDLRIQHASLRPYVTALDNAEVALLRAIDHEREAQAALGAAHERKQE